MGPYGRANTAKEHVVYENQFYVFRTGRSIIVKTPKCQNWLVSVRLETHVDSVEVDDLDVGEAGQNDVLEKLAADATEDFTIVDGFLKSFFKKSLDLCRHLGLRVFKLNVFLKHKNNKVRNEFLALDII